MPSTEKNDVKSSSSSTTSADEKALVSEVERAESANARTQSSDKVYNAHIDTSEVDERKLLRKLDWWLVPWLSFLYLLSFLDRTSIGNAKVRCPFSFPSQWLLNDVRQ